MTTTASTPTDDALDLDNPATYGLATEVIAVSTPYDRIPGVETVDEIVCVAARNDYLPTGSGSETGARTTRSWRGHPQNSYRSSPEAARPLRLFRAPQSRWPSTVCLG